MLTGTVVLFLVCFASARESATSPSTTPTSSFGYVDLFVDSGAKPLAAYQIELVISNNAAQVVGIEGGDAGAFSEPPYYDPAAMSQSRVIVAAFSTRTELPSHKLRIARVHLQFHASDRHYEAKLITAATTDGTRIDASASVSEGAQP
jgi:hypothetical protein